MLRASVAKIGGVPKNRKAPLHSRMLVSVGAVSVATAPLDPLAHAGEAVHFNGNLLLSFLYSLGSSALVFKA